MLPSGLITRLAALLSGVALLACGGNQHAGAAEFWAGGTVDPAAPEKDEQEGAKPMAARRPISTPDDFDGAPVVPEEQVRSWVGVRHDLGLARAAAPKERCSCLAVEVGEARDPRFQWAAGAPDVGGGTLAIALSARGVPCPGGAADEAERRPSISAVDQEGNDIVVEVEDLPPGRPLATGAVIPRPAPGGAIYVKGKTSKVPYARAPGGARCKVY
ncbi:hypothetical protein SOCE26_088730 [Sorangium cellulosum]|uniref:Secreted protein n=1 Tax=Sorangium cellulosum TaxID=56 RepID=A0A2L0F6Y2_SORCE|nr:hypothetical protein [Sorangium cellulosum]AUX47354.1 hypothetical protein SOCE26_088730 [Sorangium cellulosum]